MVLRKKRIVFTKKMSKEKIALKCAIYDLDERFIYFVLSERKKLIINESNYPFFLNEVEWELRYGE